MNSWDPSRTQLNTHLTNQLQKVSRLVYKYQDLTHIPEYTQLKITTFKQAKGLLAERFGREPTMAELSDELRWPMRSVSRMDRSLRKVLLGSKDEGFSSQIMDLPDRQQEVFHLIYHGLSSPEKQVWDAATVHQLKGDKAIGGHLKMDPGQVRKYRESIAKKITAFSASG